MAHQVSVASGLSCTLAGNITQLLYDAQYLRHLIVVDVFQYRKFDACTTLHVRKVVVRDEVQKEPD